MLLPVNYEQVYAVFSRELNFQQITTRKERMALKNLKENRDIVILPADQGNDTVVMDSNQYEQKMRDLLDDPVYKKIKRIQLWLLRGWF